MPFAKGKSGNLSGRPKGSGGVAGEIRQAISDQAPQLLQVIVDKALEGDSQAALALLNKIVPNLKSANEPVQFKLNTLHGLSDTGQQIIQNIANGTVSRDSGSVLVKTLADYGRLVEQQDIMDRLARLEKINEVKK